MVYLRIQLLGLQAQESWRYYVAFQLLETGATAATAQQHGPAALPADAACRTDTARASRTPVFSSSTFLLRVPTQTAPAKLAVSLFAAPSVEAPAGPIIAGREVDRLVASGVLTLEQHQAQRLRAGEHVAVPLTLQVAQDCRVQQMPEGMGSQAAQLQSLRNSQQTSSGSSSKPHMLLELMLLQAEPPGAAGACLQSLCQQAACGSLALGSSYGSLQDDVTPLGAAAATAAADAAGGDASAGSDGDIELLVLVSAASNVPMVPGPGGQLEPASAVVAVRAGVETASSGPPQARTEAAAPSSNPFWGELLCVRCQEAQLSHSRLQVSLLSSSTNRALAKGSLKLSGLLPGQHYNLALSLTDTCTLYLTVVLGLGPKTLLEALQGSGLAAAAAETAGRLQLMQAALPLLSRPWHSLLSDAAQQQAAAYEVWAVWRCAGGNGEQQRHQQQTQQEPVYTMLDGRAGAAAASTAMLRVYNSNSGLLAVGGPSRAGSAASSRDAPAAEVSDGSNLKGLGGVLAMVPLCSSSGQDVAWPQGHQVTLPVLMARETTANFELYLQVYPSSSRKLPPPVCFAFATLPLASVAGQAAGKPCQLSLLLSCNPQLTVADAAGVELSLQFTQWDVQQYTSHLSKLAHQQEQQQRRRHEQQQQRVPALLASPSPVPPNQGSVKVKASRAAAAAAAAEAGAAGVQQQGGALELLLGDLLAKQQVLEQLQRQLDLAGQCAEAAGGRAAELQAANRNLSADLQHLRQLLHEEKEASALATSLLDASQPHLLPGTHISLDTATREQVLQQLTTVLTKHATERARNGELVRRLQQLHAEKVDVMELQQQFLELQEAHFQQSKLVVDQETHQHTLATLKKAVTDQEALITRLQQLLAAAAARGKELELWKASANTLQQEVSRLREELSDLSAAGAAAEQQAAAQAAAEALADSQAAAAQATASFEAQLLSKESERLTAVMRVEWAEASAVAAQNELLDVTKRYAREIAQLKAKLAEKDAQLLGGFGSIDHLMQGGHFDSLGPTAAAAAAAAGGSGLGGFGLGSSIGGLMLPTLQELGLPASGSPLVGAAAAAVAVAASNQYGSSPSRGRSGGGCSNGSSLAAAAAAAAAAGSSALTQPDALAQGGSRVLRSPAGAAAGSEQQGSGRGFNQQGSCTLRAGSAEAQLTRQGTGEAAQQQQQPPWGSSRMSKPGSPLLPTAQQQRLTNSADGVRSPGGASVLPASFGRGSPQQQQQQGRVSRDAGPPQQAWGPGCPQQQQQRYQQQPSGTQQHWQQQQQQQRQWEAQQSRPMELEGADDEEDDEYEDEGVLDDDEAGEAEEGEQQQRQPAGWSPATQQPPLLPRPSSSSQQPPQQQQQQQAATPKKRGGLAGFFSRG